MLVVPFFNEERLLSRLLNSIANQSDREFRVVLVNNASTDGSVDVVETFLGQHRGLKLRMIMIEEAEKGTGNAADTGFRYAMALGADYIVRTDADCILERRYIEIAKGLISAKKPDVLMGLTLPRADEKPRDIEAFFFSYLPLFWEYLTSWLPIALRQYHLRGANMVIKSEVYRASGGFPRTALEEQMDDQYLLRAIKSKSYLGFHRSNELVVYSSLRRDRKYGVLSTWLWYLGINRKQGDIR